jgi:putative transposase
MPRRLPQQLSLPTPCTWGGRRRGAGRRRGTGRPTPPHSTRPVHRARHPVHVTLRALGGLPSFRSDAVFANVHRALAAASKSFFRVLQFSVQTDHLHLVVEAEGTLALTRGTQGLAIRCARAVNRALHRRGRVWGHRYHAHHLRTAREVRSAFVYVLLNFRKHLRAAPAVDPRSSGAWFAGWTRAPPAVIDAPPVVAPRTWLAVRGWRRAGGAIDWRESPALQSGPPLRSAATPTPATGTVPGGCRSPPRRRAAGRGPAPPGAG